MGIEIVLTRSVGTIRAPLPHANKIYKTLIPELIGCPAQQTTFDAADNTSGSPAIWPGGNIRRGVWRAITVLAEVERLCPQLGKAPPVAC